MTKLKDGLLIFLMIIGVVWFIGWISIDPEQEKLVESCLHSWEQENGSFSEQKYTTYSWVRDVCAVRAELAIEGYRVVPFVGPNDWVHYRNSNFEPKVFRNRIKDYLQKDTSSIF